MFGSYQNLVTFYYCMRRRVLLPTGRANEKTPQFCLPRRRSPRVTWQTSMTETQVSCLCIRSPLVTIWYVLALAAQDHVVLSVCSECCVFCFSGTWWRRVRSTRLWLLLSLPTRRIYNSFMQHFRPVIPDKHRTIFCNVFREKSVLPFFYI